MDWMSFGVGFGSGVTLLFLVAVLVPAEKPKSDRIYCPDGEEHEWELVAHGVEIAICKRCLSAASR